MEIVYCDLCGHRIPGEDLTSGKASRTDEQVLCVKCRTNRSGARLGFSSSARLKVTALQPDPSRKPSEIRLAPAARMASSPHISPHSRAKTSWGPLVAGGVFLIAMLLGSVLLIGGPKKVVPVSASPEGKHAAGSIPNAPVREIPVSTALSPSNMEKPAPVATAPANAQEKEAQEAFSNLETDCFASDDIHGRISRLEEYLAKYDASIPAARARLMLAELKKKSSSAPQVAPHSQAPDVEPKQPAPVATESPKSIGPTVPPQKVPPVDAAKAEEAFVVFAAELLGVLRTHNADTALLKVKNAVANPLFEAHQKSLAACLCAVNLLAELEKTAAQGAARLRDVDDFELGVPKRKAVRVGKRADSQVNAVQDGALIVSSQGADYRLPLDSLEPETRERLAILALQADKTVAGAVRLAFVRILQLQSANVKTAALAVKSAEAAGASPEEAACLNLLADRATREALAAAAWDELAKLADSRKPVELEEALLAFQTQQGQTAFGIAKRKEIAVRLVEAKLLRHIVAHWRMDETSGRVATDASANDMNAAYVGAPVPATDVPAVDFPNPRSLTFDGVKDRLAGPEAKLKNVTDNFTVMLWLNPTTTRPVTPQSNGGTGARLDQRYAIFPTQGTGVYGEGHAGMGLSAGTNGVSVVEHAAAYIPSLLVYEHAIQGWTHVAVVYAAKQPKLFVNGALVQTGLTSTKIVHPSCGLGGGAYGCFPGKLDDVRIYNRVLSETEIRVAAGIRKKQ